MASRESLRVERYWQAARKSAMSPDPEDLVTNDQWDVLTGEPRGVDYMEVEVDGTLALWAVPHDVPSDGPVLLCLHGGGYVGGSVFTHRKMYAHLAKAIGARALSVEYTLLPQGGVFPRPVAEGVAAYEWLLGRGVPPERIAVVGDSAGGHLAMLIQLRAREQGLPLPAATMLISPWIDMGATGESLESNAGNDAVFHKQWIVDMGAAFLDGHSPTAPDVAPLHADLSGFGPLYIQVGDQELLLDDSRMLAEHADKAGLDVRLDVFADQQHSFQMAAGLAPEADDAIGRFAAWARPKLGLA